MTVLLLAESFIIGILSTIIGFIFSSFLLGKDIKQFDNWKTVIITFFTSGVIVHLVCEIIGFNSWHCNNRQKRFKNIHL